MTALTPNFDASRADARQTLVAHRLAQAIGEGTLSVHYQPEVDLQSLEVLSFEALCRWQDAELNQVTPDEFIAVAEAKGLISLLGCEILRQVMGDMPQILIKWPKVRVAINVSGIELAQAQFADQFLGMVNKANPEFTSHLELELTESIFLYDVPTVRMNLEKLQKAGLSIAIDDFGTGQSSLARLHTLPFNKIKMDRAFILSLNEPMVQAIVKAMVQLTRDFNRSLVIEGLETHAQLNLLTQLGCHVAQGYLISPPKKLAELPDHFKLA